MRVILKKNPKIKEPPPEKIVVSSLDDLIEFKEHVKPYDKKNMDFGDYFHRTDKQFVYKEKKIDSYPEDETELTNKYHSLLRLVKGELPREGHFGAYSSYFKYREIIPSA